MVVKGQCRSSSHGLLRRLAACAALRYCSLGQSCARGLGHGDVSEIGSLRPARTGVCGSMPAQAVTSETPSAPGSESASWRRRPGARRCSRRRTARSLAACRDGRSCRCQRPVATVHFWQLSACQVDGGDRCAGQFYPLGEVVVDEGLDRAVVVEPAMLAVEQRPALLTSTL